MDKGQQVDYADAAIDAEVAGCTVVQAVPGDADGWRLHLVGQDPGSGTVGRRIKCAKQLLKARRSGLADSHPFAKVKTTAACNHATFHFVTLVGAQKTPAGRRNAQRQLIFALSRFGRLRCLGEHLSLEWSDIDRERNRILVHSPKTKHPADGKARLVPLLPELQPHLPEVPTSWMRASTSSPATATPGATCGPSWNGSSRRWG